MIVYRGGRECGFRFIAFPFQSCPFPLALLWSHTKPGLAFFFLHSVGGVGTEKSFPIGLALKT